MTFSTAKITQRRERELNRLAAWSLTLTLVGYPIAGMISTAFNWDSTVTSLPYRIAVLLFTLFLIVRCPPSSAWIRKSPWLIIFHGIYIARLLWDLLIAKVPTTDEALMTYAAFNLPALAIAPIAGYLRESEVAKQITILGGMICTLAIALHWMGWSADRSGFDHTLRLGFEAVNPITLGHVATTTILAALTVLWQRRSRPLMAVAAATIPISLTCMILAASRGPFVSLFACALVFLFYRGNRKILALVAVTVLIGLAFFIVSGDGFQLFVRFEGIDEERSALERLLLQGNAIAQFLDHPILGNAALEVEFLTYPHNMFIETAMALGILGLLLMGILLLKAAREANLRLRIGQILVPLLFVQYFVGFQFSGALWGYATFWAILAILLCAGRSNRGNALTRGKPDANHPSAPRIFAQPLPPSRRQQFPST